MRVKEKHPKPYYDGLNARAAELASKPPYSSVTQTTDFFWWMAGWNDADIELNKKKELV